MSDTAPIDLAALRALVGRMIPASTEYGAPGADDEAILADLVETLGPGAAMLADLLADPAPAAFDLQRLGQAHPAAFGMLTVVLAECYYRDDRVMRALGMEPRPPFPKGFELEEGDWSLLDPVRGRPVLWRSC